MDNLNDAPDFSARGGVIRARALFGARLPKLIEELTDALVSRYLSADRYRDGAGNVSNCENLPAWP
jgi:hypothetical protein